MTSKGHMANKNVYIKYKNFVWQQKILFWLSSRISRIVKQKLAKISKFIYCGILISREPLVQSSDSQGLHRHLLRTAVIRDSSLSIGSSQPCTVPLPPPTPTRVHLHSWGGVGWLPGE